MLVSDWPARLEVPDSCVVTAAALSFATIVPLHRTKGEKERVSVLNICHVVSLID